MTDDGRLPQASVGGALPASQDRAGHEPSPASGLGHTVAIPSASRRGASSDQYDCVFYGIVNRSGALWTPLIFGSVKAAEDYRDSTAARWGEKFASIPRTHKIVPVEFLIEPTQAIEARRAETGTGSVHESAVPKGCAQTPADTPPLQDIRSNEQ